MTHYPPLADQPHELPERTATPAELAAEHARFVQARESQAVRAGESGRSQPREVIVTVAHDMWFTGAEAGTGLRRGIIARCGPCKWSVSLDAAHDLADLINLYAQHAGLDAAKDLCISTLAKIAPESEPEPEPAYKGECSAEHPRGLVCTLENGHAGDHEAHGIYEDRPPYEVWPQEHTLPDVAQPSDLPVAAPEVAR